MKKIISLFLAALMIFSVFGVACYASSLPNEMSVSSLKNTEEGIKISWISDYSAYEFEIWKNKNDSGWELLTTETTSYYVDTDVQNGSTYSYSIRGVNSSGAGPFDDVGKSIVRIGVINPTLKMLPDGVSVSWKKVPGCDSYKIYKGTSSYYMDLVKTVDGNTLTYTDKKAANGTTTMYSVVGVANGSEGPTPSTPKEIYFLKAPKVKSVKNENGQIVLRWAENSAAYSYIVYRKKPGGKYKELTTTYSTYYYDTSVTSGQKYIYAVQAACNNIKSKSGESKTITFLAKTTATVSNTQTGVKVKWTKVKGADGYKIYRKVGKGSQKFLKKVSAKTTSYIDKKATSGKNNSYVVKAYKSNVTVGSDAASVLYLKAPKIKSIKATSSGAKLTWSKVPGAKGYYIYEKRNGGYYYLNAVKGTQFTDVTIKTGRSKWYKVNAYNGEDESALSAGKKVKQSVKNKQVPSRVQMAGYAIFMLNVKLKNPSTMRINQVYYKGDTVYIWYSAANGFGNMVDGWLSCHHSSRRGLFEYSVVFGKGFICVYLDDSARPNTWDGTIPVSKAMKEYNKIPEITWYNPVY